MKKWLFFFYSLSLIPLSLLAQKEVVSTTTDFIVAGKFDDANHYLDSLLKYSPTNVDAMMMKGNVILNRELGKIPVIRLNAHADESVFTSEIGEMSESIKIVPVQTAREIEKWWKKCLKVDNKRIDIHQGMCTLYAMALMKEELKNQIITLLKVKKDETGEQAFNLAEYARKFEERDRFGDAIEVYEFIAQQFPDPAGIRCDIGSEFFYKGQMKDALRYLDSALSKKNIDESSYLNAAFIYSELGYFENAQKCFADYSTTYQAKMDVFYKGLMLFSDSDKKYADTLNQFIHSIDSNAYYPEYLLAKELMSFDAFTMENYEQIMSGKHPEWYLPLIYQRAMRQYPDSCNPFIDYGIFQSRIQNYLAAIQFLEEGEHCNLEPERKEYWRLHYAFALYQSGVKDKALLNFNPVTLSANPFNRQAAMYFVAKMLVEVKQPEKAKVLLKEIANEKETTKYKSLSSWMLQQMK